MNTLRDYIRQYEDLFSHGKIADVETRRDLENKMSKLFAENKEDIGSINNYYGGLSVAKVGGSYFWAIENYDGWLPEEITEALYEALQTFNTKE